MSSTGSSGVSSGPTTTPLTSRAVSRALLTSTCPPSAACSTTTSSTPSSLAGPPCSTSHPSQTTALLALTCSSTEPMMWRRAKNVFLKTCMTHSWKQSFKMFLLSLELINHKFLKKEQMLSCIIFFKHRTFYLKRCIFRFHWGDLDHSVFLFIVFAQDGVTRTRGALPNSYDRGHWHHTFCSSGVKSLACSLILLSVPVNTAQRVSVM